MVQKTLILIIAILGLVSSSLIEVGERVPGDVLLHTETQYSILTQNPTQHSLIFVWAGNNETYSLVEFDTNGYDFSSMSFPGEPYERRWYATVITSFSTTQLQITATVYGLTNQYLIDSAPGTTLESKETIITTSRYSKPNV